MGWSAWPHEKIAARVRQALNENRSYREHGVLGVPGSMLDPLVFPETDFTRGSAFLTAFLANPNHIGCHTQGRSEGFFAGTQALEREALRLCAEEIMGAAAGEWDGYIASGGTESNIHALWVSRNHMLATVGCDREAIAVLRTEDTHYSIPKACDLLGLTDLVVPVHPTTRAADEADVRAVVARARERGTKAVIAVLNLGTTMFGSVDAPDPMLAPLAAEKLPHVVHVDAAFGGFVYPFTCPGQPLDFRDPRVQSVTLDAHKMLQAPYGTGICLLRKGLLEHVRTDQASYVRGGDMTLSGSRSGANAIAVWMILRAWGSEGGAQFCAGLMRATDSLCATLAAAGIRHFRQAGMNVVAIRAEHVAPAVAERFGLVPDRHDEPQWFKVVVMDHVTSAQLDALAAALQGSMAA